MDVGYDKEYDPMTLSGPITARDPRHGPPQQSCGGRFRPWRRHILPTGLALCSALLCLPALSFAEVQVSWGVPIVQSTESTPLQIHLADDGAGGAIVAWDLWPSGWHEIHYMRVNAQGEVVWGPILMGTGNYDADMKMELVASGDHFHLIWIGNISDLGFFGAIAQKFNISDGEPVWQEYPQGFPLPREMISGDDYLVACADSVGNALVAFTTQPGAPSRVFVSFLWGTGSSPVLPWGDDGTVRVAEPASGAWLQLAPSIVTDGTGGAVVSWTQCREDSTLRLQVQRLSSEGDTLWGGRGVEAAGSPEDLYTTPLITHAGEGGAVLSWMQHDPGPAVFRMYTRRLDPVDPLSGWGSVTVTGPVDETVVPPVPHFFEEYPDSAELVYIAASPGGATAAQLLATKLGAETGSSVWSQSELLDLGGFTASLQAVTDGMSGAIVAWMQSDVAIEAVHVQGCDGALDGGKTTIAGAANAEPFLALSSSDNGAAYLAWAESGGVFVQRLQVPFPDCPVPDTVWFGSVAVCSRRDTTLTLQNISAEPMPLAIAFEPGSFPAFTLVTDPLPEVIGPGETETLTLRFQPQSGGSNWASLHITYDCRVELAGTGVIPVCQVSPASLDFGPVIRGAAASLSDSFTVRNGSSGIMAASVSLTSGADEGFALTGGEADYLLGPGAERTFEVTFTYAGSPADPCGERSGSVATGAQCGCSSVALSATLTDHGVLGTLPGSVDFGTRTILENPEADPPYTTNFLLTNETEPECGSWNGTIWLENLPQPPLPTDPPIFSVDPAAPQPVTLPPQASQTVTVEFRPYEPISYNAVLLVENQGSGEIDTIAVAGTGSFGNPACAFCDGQEAPGDTIRFETTLIDDSTRIVVCLTNSGGGIVAGEAFLEGTGCGAFRLQNAHYELEHLEEDSLGITFAPTEPGSFTCNLDWGSGCESLGPRVLTGEAVASGSCRLSGDSLDFGTVLAGETVSRSVIVYNDGGQPISASMSVMSIRELGLTPPEPSECLNYNALDDLLISVDPGDSCEVAFSFSPQELEGGWVFADTLDLYGDCEGLSIFCKGQSVNAGACSTNVNYPDAPSGGEPQILDFGELEVGKADTLTFAIQNAGLAPCTAVSGTVASTCALGSSGCGKGDLLPNSNGPFTIIAGEGPYDLACGEIHLVTVLFAPSSEGSFECAITTDCSADVACTGSAHEPLVPICLVEPDTLEFPPVCHCESDSAQLSHSATAAVVITNIGQVPLEGTIAISSATEVFHLQPPAPAPPDWPQYSLPDSGDALAFEVMFTTSDTLLHTATLLPGNGACVTLPVLAQAYHPGDLDRNRQIALDDFLGLLDHLLEREPLSQEDLLFGFGDLNCDARRDVSDLVRLAYTIGETVAQLGNLAILAMLPARYEAMGFGAEVDPGGRGGFQDEQRGNRPIIAEGLPRLEVRLLPGGEVEDGFRRWALSVHAPPGGIEVLALAIRTSDGAGAFPERFPSGRDGLHSVPAGFPEDGDAGGFVFHGSDALQAWSVLGPDYLGILAYRSPSDMGQPFSVPKGDRPGDETALPLGNLSAPSAWEPSLSSDGSGILGLALTPAREPFLLVPAVPIETPTTGARLVLLSPNPSPGALGILLAASMGERIRLDLFDVQGRRVARLWNGPLGAESSWVFWDGGRSSGTPVSTGVYFANLRSAGRSEMRRFMIVR